MIVQVQAGMQANQFASIFNRTGNITNFTKNCAGKSFIFSHNSKEACSLIFVSVIRKGVSGKHPIHKKNAYSMCVFIKDIIQETNCYWHVIMLITRSY